MKKILFKYWILKVVAYWLLNPLPSKILYFFQVNVIKRKSLHIEEINEDFKFFSKNITSLSNKNKNLNLLEFGAGKNLALNIYLSFLFPNISQTVIDINDMFDANLFYNAYCNIAKILKIKNNYSEDKIAEILKLLRITYISPMDILNLDKKNEYDFCISRDTLEHIPKYQLNKIIKKISNILKPNSYMLHKIDYSDHYSNSYNSISKLNFLKYNEFFWFLLNPSNHYQNRLRHSQYIDIIKNNDFKIIKSEKTSLDNLDMKIDNKFKFLIKDDLLSTSGQIIATND